MKELCPSILSADFNRLGEQMKLMEEEQVKWVHIDVMDGMFVPSISFGMPVIRSIRKESPLFFDVHLMIQEPSRYIQEFVDCGADSLTIHLEACADPMETLRQIHAAGIKTGLSIKPATPAEAIIPYLSETDLILVMTVEPGFGGQPYIEASTEKIRQVRRILDEAKSQAQIQVDGGIYDTTVGTVLSAGAELIVAGSWVFKGDLRENLRHAMGLLKT